MILNILKVIVGLCKCSSECTVSVLGNLAKKIESLSSACLLIATHFLVAIEKFTMKEWPKYQSNKRTPNILYIVCDSRANNLGIQ